MRKTYKSVFRWTFVSCLALGLNLSCSDDGDEEEEDETTTTGSVSSYSPTTTTAASGSSIAAGALNLSALPNMSDALSTSDTSLALAVSGTPPKFSEILPSTLETYLSGSVTELINNISTETNKSSPSWDTVDGYIQSFRAGQTKCRVMEQAARSVGELASNTNSQCYMSNIDKESGSLLVYESGEEIDPGYYFIAPSGTTEAAPIVREIKMVDQRILFSISNDSNIYKVKLNFCTLEGAARGIDVITINSNTGSESMTFQTYHGGTEEYEGESQTFEFTSTLEAGVKSEVASDGTVKLVFDKSKPRKMDIRGFNSSSAFTHNYNSILDIVGDQLTTRFISSGSSTQNNKTYSDTVKGYSKVQFTGTDAGSVAILQGAGHMTGTFKDPDQSSSDSFDEIIGFEFQESASPRYATVTSSTLLTDVNAANFTTDDLLKNSAPIAADADIKALAVDTACAVTPTSVYTLDVTSAAFGEIDSLCENHFSEGSRICNALQEKEQQIFSALRAKTEAGH